MLVFNYTVSKFHDITMKFAIFLISRQQYMLNIKLKMRK